MENRFKTSLLCGLISKDIWMCNLPKGHAGDTHVAIGLGDRVVKVWTLETVTETRERVDFLKEAA